jgi:uncharacterized protein YfaS (alpha-2-macroglobulin family)
METSLLCSGSGPCSYENGTSVLAFANFTVEEYKAPDYKAELSFDKEEYVNSDTLRADVRGSYFFGAPLSNAKLTWSIVAQNYYFDAYTKEWFNFSDSDYSYGCYGQCPYQDAYVTNGETTLDENGHATLTNTIDLSKDPTTSKIYTLYTTVNDGNNRTTSANKSVVVHRGEFYVGVRSEDYVVKEKTPTTITTITVDPKGTPLAGKKLSAELVNIEWTSVKKKNVDGFFYWDNEQKEKVVANYKKILIKKLLS